MKITQQFKSILSFLKHPYPEAENMSIYIRSIFIIAVFVTLFLGLIQPFNMDQTNGKVWLFSLIFGAITFTAGLCYEIMIRYVFRIKKEGKSYTFIRWIIQVIGLLIFIALFNYLYLAYQFGMPLKGFMYMMYATFLVGVFPTVFIGTISLIKSEKRNAEIAAILNEKTIKPKPVVHESSLFDISADMIWVIESIQNYVNIYYKNGESIEKKVERATLKSCEDLIENTDLLRCHRSFIINTSKIENVSGNAQGLKLKLVDFEIAVPVSRSYIPLFKV
tara:strand:- start:2027 stop:2857 length:831 start_codon:yes stop_codon:yes gene_type:complete